MSGLEEVLFGMGGGAVWVGGGAIWAGGTVCGMAAGGGVGWAVLISALGVSAVGMVCSIAAVGGTRVWSALLIGAVGVCIKGGTA